MKQVDTPRDADGLLGFQFQKLRQRLGDPYTIVGISPQVYVLQRSCAHHSHEVLFAPLLSMSALY